MTKPSEIRSKIYLFIQEKCGATVDMKVWHEELKALLVELVTVENDRNQVLIEQLKNEVANKTRTITLLEQNIARLRGGKPSNIVPKPQPKIDAKKYSSLAERMESDLKH